MSALRNGWVRDMSIPGSMGRVATFHSTNRKRRREHPPMASMLITMGVSHEKYEPPPEMGMSTKMMPTEDVSTP